MKIDRYTGVGILFILLAIVIFFTDVLNPFIRPFTYLFLMGSSKGKDILFFTIFGIFLILSQLFEYNTDFKNNRFVKKLMSHKFSSIFKLKNNTYIKISLTIFLATAIFGLILEIIMRYQMGISPLTTFIAMNNGSIASTSIIHSHIYKSVIGGIIDSIFSIITIGIPAGVNTGDALLKYVPNIANIIIVILPILFLTQLGSMKNRFGPSRIFLIFTSTCGLIGIFDGGLFGVPCAAGIYGMLLVYFDETGFDYYFAKLFRNKSILNKTKGKMDIIKKYKILSYKTFKRFIPHLFVILLIILRLSVSLLGTNTEYYEVEIMNPTATLEDIKNSLNSYSILSIQENKENNGNNINNIIIHISPEYNEDELLNSLIKSLKNKCSGYSMTWNAYSYFNSNTTNLTNSTNTINLANN
ncbi:hypothetical protein KQY27_02105 [Methanobrevibacter sp. TMH8]|uniref:hypothetical protein n=1 Tax=Methanobrevibacter sp. TMH8 TaxID=2848611 RepID=UPI001CCA59A4|nr:hypothetical protein [Methanobrevibacter sp. TMH8]MBZ9570337.1 hypothetical protein [Methanobrevibacter sp. TMH8]